MDKKSAEMILLASLLGAPDQDAREALLELGEHYDWLKTASDQIRVIPLEEWQTEYQRLFVTGHPRPLCPPFESAYLNGRRQGTAAAELKAFYARIGLCADVAPPDYLGTQLECAAFLLDRHDGDPAELEELIQGHMSRWVPRFARDLERHSSMELYRVLAEKLAALIPEPDRADRLPSRRPGIAAHARRYV